MAIVKADAYGHGAVRVAQTLAAAGADFFGVSNLNEALELRENGITTPLLILAYTPPEHASVLAAYNLTQTVFDSAYAEALAGAAKAAGVTVRVHLKLDTGMSRIGFFCQDTSCAPLDDIVRVCALEHLEAEGVFTHFAVADEPNADAVTREQFARFLAVLDALKKRGITFAVRHCCNSAATLRFPEMHLDMVRVGISLYGVPPSAETADAQPLRPAMTLKTAVAQVKDVPTGTAVSYGHTFVCERPTTLATLPIGYADGLLRLASGRFFITINGQKAPLVGRVCMDQCTVDVTDLDAVREGLVATVFGSDALSVSDYAASCLTIPYESLCHIGKRVPRVYVQKEDV